MKRVAIWLGVVALALCLVLPGTASALTFYTDRASWEAAAGSFASADLSPYFGLPTTAVALPYGETLTFDHALVGGLVPATWATWSGGKTPYVLTDLGSTGVTGTFTPGQLDGFGLEIEPNVFSQFLITLTLSTGDVFGQLVEGFAGAKFFGWIEPLVVSMTISIPSDALGYAIGEFVAAQGRAVPEPGTLLLIGTGLVGLGFWRRFKA